MKWKVRSVADPPSAPGSNQRIWTVSNVVTIVRILLVPVFVAVLLAPWPQWFGLDHVLNDSWKQLIAAIVFVVISGTDWLDGYLARSRNEVTDFGKFMDPLADKILVAAALISLVELDALPTWVVLIILAREFIVSGVRMMAASKGVVIAASMLGKVKTVLQMIAIVLFVLKGSYVHADLWWAVHDPFWVFSWLVMLAALAMTIASLVDYLVKARALFGFANPKTAESPVEVENEAERQELLQAAAAAVVAAAQERGAVLATAESLTGGMIGQALTGVPGSSAVFNGSIVSYANSAKHRLLGVPQEVLDGPGAVSEECALAMAQGARERLGADFAVAVTGIAGPGGAEPGKPVGTVWIGFSAEGQGNARRFQFGGTREEVRQQTAIQALETLLSAL